MICLSSIDEIYTLLEEKLKDTKPLFLVIDGRCGSGKTSLAKCLHQQFGGALFHMDDFLLPFTLRTPSRMEESGGHVHFERLQAEVLNPLAHKQDVEVRPYRCQLQDFISSTHVAYHPFHILEGSFSHHPSLQAEGQLRLFLTCPKEVQLQRLQRREGVQGLLAYTETWIVKEEQYFDTFSTETSCHLHLDTGNLFP